MINNSHVSEQFLDHLDSLSGLARTLENKRNEYEATVENLKESNYVEEDHAFDEVSDLLERVFDEIDALDSLIEYSDMEAPVKKRQ